MIDAKLNPDSIKYFIDDEGYREVNSYADVREALENNCVWLFIDNEKGCLILSDKDDNDGDNLTLIGSIDY